LTLAAVTLAVYLQTVNHLFIQIDDDVYVTSNPHVTTGITIKNIAWAFASVEATNWHPVTWLSHMMDVQLYGMNPGGHHLTNVLIHTITSVLLLLLLLRLTGALWQSSFVAALFALHPLHVESVAWVAERKDVLSGLFWIITIFFYVNYTERRNLHWYLLALFSFLVGLMCKPMLVTLPVIMLLLDFWPLERHHFRKEGGTVGQAEKLSLLMREKIPFFFAALLSGIITIYAQHAGGATQSLVVVPLVLRMQNALVGYVKYIGKTLWPHDLAAFYPYAFSIPLWQTAIALLILLVISAAVIRLLNQKPYLALGWFWFIITLLPVIGLIQVGNQSMADRYSYIPLIGLFIMVGWGIPDLMRSVPQGKLILAAASMAVIVASSLLTWKQVGYWRDDLALSRHSLAVTTGNDFMHNVLGMALYRKGEPDSAINEFVKALLINPTNYIAHNNLGMVLEKKGDLYGAIQHYHDSLKINPLDDVAHTNLGIIFAQKGDMNAAINEFKKVVQNNPNSIKGISNLAMALDDKGDLDEAIREYRKVVAINPGDIDAHNNMALIFLRREELDTAITELREVLTIDPNHSTARDNLRTALLKKKDAKRN